MVWYCFVWFGMALYGFVGIVCKGVGGQMTSEFIHVKISILSYDRRGRTIIFKDPRLNKI